jgi:hypothetical protein
MTAAGYLGNNHLLWENRTFIVCTPFNPHVSYSEGPNVIVKPKQGVAHAWQDPILTGQAFQLAAKVTQAMDELKLAPWFNLQANGNWGLLDGAEPFFHIYIYGRNQTSRWAKPIILPEAPGTYHNQAMPEADRVLLSERLKERLTHHVA